jgi:hypothetical protein
MIPSHFAPAQTSTSPLGHAGRAPCGSPTIDVHVPSVPTASHAAHCPWQAMLQQ